MSKTVAHPHRHIEHRVHSTNPDIALLPADHVFERLNTSDSGLTLQQATERLHRHGPNTITVQLPTPIASLLRENFLHTMAILLWVAGLAGFLAQMPELGIAIWVVNIVNGTFSFWQEYRAEKSTEALKKLLPVMVQVVRDGVSTTIPAAALVPGDLLVISEGDRISADARVVSAEALGVDQSTLTGESRTIHKTSQAVELSAHSNSQLTRADIPNLLFAGTTVLTGHGSAVVYATGTATEFGRIAHLTQTIAEQPSPLQKEMARVTRVVSVLAVSIGVVIFALAVTINHTNPAQAFIFAMGMIVAFVPEGMVPTVTLSLALAVQRMAKRKALMKRLSSVEALGCTNVICTDKTGTLTQNQMTVTRALAGGLDYTFTGLGYGMDGTIVAPGGGTLSKVLPGDLSELLVAGALCNNASLSEEGQVVTFGDPTEMAIVVAAGKGGTSRQQEEKRLPRIHENPFDSHRKCMSTVHDKGADRIAYVKGSPGIILDQCTRTLADGTEQLLDEFAKTLLRERIDSYAKEGLRVIAAAKKNLSQSDDVAAKHVERDLTFLGIFAMYDPPHKEVPAAVENCRKAGIQVVMITGDYEITAEAIARQVGILSEGPTRVITGANLDRITDQELVELVTGVAVFARVNPEHKLRVVQAFQRCGKIVAVTGDGVNDAPALKKADIGVAMGLAGTGVAREAADMILLDDNFASIVNAVQEGRAVYDNIKKFAVYVFNSNMAEAVPFIVMLLSCGLVPLPLTVMQVLSIDLGTDMVPAIGLGADHSDEDVMLRKPRSLQKPLLSADLLIKALLWYGLIEAAAGMSGYLFANYLHGWPQVPLATFGSSIWREATTMTLTCIVAAQVGAVFCCRTQRRSIFSVDLFSNKLILAGVLFELILLACLIYVPFLQHIFNTASLSVVELCFALLWTTLIVLFDELRKLGLRHSK